MEPITAVCWIQFGCLLILWKGLADVQAEICSGPVCKFELDVRIFRTMTYRDQSGSSYPVYLDGTELKTNIKGLVQTLSPNDVIVADGFERDVTVFNGQLPGPTIEVMEGVQLVITVNNRMRQRVVTVHWHGILQNNTYFMDGAEDVTQCPILPGQSFTYRFWALPVGTHWYHAHQASMRLDGLFGMLIIHASPPTIPYFPIMVNDWNHVTSEQAESRIDDRCEKGTLRTTYGAQIGAAGLIFRGCELDSKLYTSSLFGGNNRWKNRPFPLKFYIVKAGDRYRFRVVNAGHTFPFQISIDKHQLTIVASDGAEIEPLIVDSFFIAVSESIDFEINADRTPGRYWIRADTQCVGAFARGILAYKGFEGDIEDPSSEPRECTSVSPCRVFNCPFGRYPDGSNNVCIAMSKARSTLSSHELSQKFGIGDGEEDVTELFLNYAMYGGASVNGRRFKMPRVPLFQDVSTESDCVGEPCLDYCTCRCTEITTLPYGRTVRLIVSNLHPHQRGIQDMHHYHIFHFHGHQLALLAERFSAYNSSTEKTTGSNTDISCGSDFLCAHPHWSGRRPDFSDVSHPVIKDAITIPVQGYVVLQFKTYNPGYWMLHCHVDIHMLGGMASVFKIAPDQFPDLPPGFPTCEEFVERDDEL